jgi:predicted regulator of Ras-like GTPase activity (Roadblock/LC7/MglB family)
MLKQILEEFLSIDGVTTAALVGRDGFVIEIAETDPTDSDALGVLCSDSMRFFGRNGASMKMGTLRQIVLEYRNGVLIITPVTPDEFLVILTDTTTVLGRLTYTLAKTSSRVLAVI